MSSYRVNKSYSYQRQSRKTSSYTARRLERKTRRGLFISLLIAAGLLYLVFFWILPNLIGGLSLIKSFRSPVKPVASSLDLTKLAPPVLNIPFDATNSANLAVKGYAESNTTVEIYLDGQVVTSVKTSEDGSFTTDPIELNSGENRLSGVTTDNLGHNSLASKAILVTLNNEKPVLNITEPQDNLSIKGDKKVKVSGSVNPPNNISVTVNGIRAIVNSDGNFSQTIDINEGENNLTIIALDDAGNSTQVTRKVTLQL